MTLVAPMLSLDPALDARRRRAGLRERLGAWLLGRPRRAALDPAPALLQAAQTRRSQTEFLANTSHELRTPLNAVIGYAELLATGIPGPLTAKQAEYVTLIRQSGSHLLDLVTDMLDLAQLEAGRLTLQGAAIEPRVIVERCARRLEARVAPRGLRLGVDVAADVPAITVDAARLEQILLHLLANAVKFSAPGALVGLAVRRAGGGAVAFSVSDSGPGMTDAEIRIALEAFGQVDGSLERRHEGAGLGLPLARRLTELHGGTLTIASAKGRGTTVTVALPLGAA
jgi:signal transduction histidine kinase